ncbi:MAG: CPBP family intramembrane glutamic endopeptidase [Thermodesulfobacteriota bacterium]|nr:CPBP family intramembrane glutamic endopeptidase [Thermodesulfobacteriota bacterium]
MAAKTIETRIFLLSIAALLITEGAISFVACDTPCLPMPILGATRVVEISLFLLIVSVWGRGVPSIGLEKANLASGLHQGLIWSAMFGLFALLGFGILYVAGRDPVHLIRTHLPSGTAELLLFFTVGGLVAPVAEEIFFRGIVYGFLRRWGMVVALVGSTLIFVLAHAIQSGIPLTQIVGGIVFAVAYEITDNLMVPITIHVLGNTAIFALSLLA